MTIDQLLKKRNATDIPLEIEIIGIDNTENFIRGECQCDLKCKYTPLYENNNNLYDLC